MNANDVIESYVTEVAVLLPRKQRNDVAFELRALLGEGLQAHAEAAGRGVDEAMATEYLNAFGRPVDVAARYRPTLTIIDPADGHAFLRTAVIGLVIIWCAGLLMLLRQPIDSAGGLLSALGQWWVSIVIPSLWWPGLLVVSFGAAAWVRRRWPQTSAWTPRADERHRGTRVAMALGLFGILGGLFVLIDPRWLLDVFLGGRAAPAAYEALTYTERFRQRQAPYVLVLLALNIPIVINVIVYGRWLAVMRRIELEMSIVLCGVLAWTVLDGPVFISPVSDRAVKSALVLIIVLTLVRVGAKRQRIVRPAPSPRIHA